MKNDFDLVADIIAARKVCDYDAMDKAATDLFGKTLPHDWNGFVEVGVTPEHTLGVYLLFTSKATTGYPDKYFYEDTREPPFAEFKEQIYEIQADFLLNRLKFIGQNSEKEKLKTEITAFVKEMADWPHNSLHDASEEADLLLDRSKYLVEESEQLPKEVSDFMRDVASDFNSTTWADRAKTVIPLVTGKGEYILGQETMEDFRAKAASWSQEKAALEAVNDAGNYHNRINFYGYVPEQMTQTISVFADTNPHYRDALQQFAPGILKEIEKDKKWCVIDGPHIESFNGETDGYGNLVENHYWNVFDTTEPEVFMNQDFYELPRSAVEKIYFDAGYTVESWEDSAQRRGFSDVADYKKTVEKTSEYVPLCDHDMSHKRGHILDGLFHDSARQPTVNRDYIGEISARQPTVNHDYIGEIVGIYGAHVIQNANGVLVDHQRASLSGKGIEEGRSVTIRYPFANVGIVRSGPELGNQGRELKATGYER
jgi:hypothetical protein